MNSEEAKKTVLMLAAAYPSWTATESTFALYSAVLMPLAAEDVEAAAMEFIRSPREFAPSAGQLYTRAKELQREREDRLVRLSRVWEPGELRVTPTGIYIQADENGKPRVVPEPKRPERPVPRSLHNALNRLIEAAKSPRAAFRRLAAPERIGALTRMEAQRHGRMEDGR